MSGSEKVFQGMDVEKKEERDGKGMKKKMKGGVAVAVMVSGVFVFFLKLELRKVEGREEEALVMVVKNKKRVN